jgi:hypothetical protein
MWPPAGVYERRPAGPGPTASAYRTNKYRGGRVEETIQLWTTRVPAGAGNAITMRMRVQGCPASKREAERDGHHLVHRKGCARYLLYLSCGEQRMVQRREYRAPAERGRRHGLFPVPGWIAGNHRSARSADRRGRVDSVPRGLATETH